MNAVPATTTQIAISHLSAIPSAMFDDFVNTVSAPNLNLRVQPRDSVVYGSLEWVIPTVVFVYLGKAYFDGFLKEAGKDHYEILKRALKVLWGKFRGPNAPHVTVISGGGKAKGGDQRYSLLLSVLAEADSNLRFKLLLEREVSEEEADEVVDAFLSFVEDFHNHALEVAAAERLKSARVLSGTIFVAFDRTTKTIEPKDPLEGR